MHTHSAHSDAKSSRIDTDDREHRENKTLREERGTKNKKQTKKQECGRRNNAATEIYLQEALKGRGARGGMGMAMGMGMGWGGGGGCGVLSVHKQTT